MSNVKEREIIIGVAELHGEEILVSRFSNSDMISATLHLELEDGGTCMYHIADLNTDNTPESKKVMSDLHNALMDWRTGKIRAMTGNNDVLIQDAIKDIEESKVFPVTLVNGIEGNINFLEHIDFERPTRDMEIKALYDYRETVMVKSANNFIDGFISQIL